MTMPPPSVPPSGVSAARLAAIMAQTPLIVPFAIGTLGCEFACNGTAAATVSGALVVLGAEEGRIAVAVPTEFLDRILAQSPEPLALQDLAEGDAGLMLDHLATPFLMQFEERLGQSLGVLGVLQNEIIGAEFEPIGFTLTQAEQVFDCAFFVSDDRLRGRLAALISAHNEAGRAIQQGEIVAMGPVVLSREEADAIAIGDVIVMEGAKFGQLTGAFRFSDGAVRPADLADGFATLKAPDSRQQPDGIPIYFEVGSAARASSGENGARIQFLPFEGHQIFVCRDRHRIGTGELVDAGGSLAISIKTLGDT